MQNWHFLKNKINVFIYLDTQFVKVSNATLVEFFIKLCFNFSNMLFQGLDYKFKLPKFTFSSY
jgi:hypothetical protein